MCWTVSRVISGYLFDISSTKYQGIENLKSSREGE